MAAPRFHPLTVTAVEKTIRDAVCVTLKPANDTDFAFEPGQYLTFRQDIDGTEIRRSYSICAGLDDGVLQVGIKRVDGGAFSTWANTNLKPGDTLEAMPPMGRFTTDLAPDHARHYLAFAGGSGITPVLSLLKSILAREPDSRFTLVYANRGVATIMFREEIEDLKDRYLGRLTVIHVLEQDATEIELFTGRVDGEKCAALFKHWIDPRSVDMAFICGPEPMMLAIAESLRQHGLTDDQIKFELFASAQPGRLAKPVASAALTAAEAEAKITLDGATRTVPLAPGQTILDAALEAGLDAPFACKGGVCSTCRCKLTSGEATMIKNHALEEYEIARGYILSCQAVPVSGPIAVDYDQ